MKSLRLDLQFFAGEKTEKATPKKQQDTRKKGQVAKSMDVNTAFILLGGFLFLLVFSDWFGGKIKHQMEFILEKYLTLEVTLDNLEVLGKDIVLDVVMILAPLFLITFVIAYVSNLAQIGFLFSTEAIAFKLSKIDPIAGAKRIFSLRALVELVKSILKMSIIGVVTVTLIYSSIDKIFTLSFLNLEDSVKAMFDLMIMLGIYGAASLIFVAIFDLWYQRFDYAKNIRMSKQEIKEEYKNMEGDPQIKAQRRQRQREMAMRRMMQDVPNADVIITNPTHYAIALKYDESKKEAPYVVAKGVDYLAERIKKMAKEHEIPTIENRLLARSLYSEVEIGQEIPEAFFKAVAEILAIVYKQQGKI